MVSASWKDIFCFIPAQNSWMLVQRSIGIQVPPTTRLIHCKVCLDAQLVLNSSKSKMAMNFTKCLCGSPKMYGFVSPYFEYAIYSYNSLLIVVSNQCEDAAKVS